ncbi:TerD domain-containing protein [Endogone sp. FLAS-F59071]|nr:TerD domain-containing protein [Endogone sp. FLAS-F59071]|eukprot:RUS23391.1 TerD domain-containing protein [Endogone sp. FLAS-F59071]
MPLATILRDAILNIVRPEGGFLHLAALLRMFESRIVTMSSSLSSGLNSSSRRLLHDLKELYDQPLRDAAATPLDNDLYEWHANIVIEPNVFLHLILQFPISSYPARPPVLTLCTPLPHANVFDLPLGYSLCLDMLEHGDFAAQEQRERAWSGWSSSYTVRGVLMQLQAYLFDEKLLYAVAEHGTMERSVKTARQFRCGRCGHANNEPFPVLPTKEELEKIVPILVKKPALLPIIAPPKQKALTVQKKETDEDGWITVPFHNGNKMAKNTFKKASGYGPKLDAVPSPAKIPLAKSYAQAATLSANMSQKPFAQLPEKPDVKITPSIISTTVFDRLEPEVFEKEQPKPKKAVVLSLSEVGHVMLEYNIQVKKDKNGKQIKSKPNNKYTKHTPPPKHVLPAPEPVPEPVYQPLPSNFDWKAVVPPATATSLAPSKVKAARQPPSYETLGALKVFPYELLIQIFSTNLSDGDILRVSNTCRILRTICEDGHLWRKVFKRLYPTSRLTAANFSDWKHVYQLEVNQLGYDMICFHTKASFEEDVLGIPIEFTMNPRTKKVDYIASSWDLLSRTAFWDDKIRITVFKEKFTDWLPLYITHDHFVRALPDIKYFMVRMSPHWQTNTFDCEMVLEVIPKMMNTLIVLICDKGVHASEKAIEGYFLLHRLFVSLIQEFPRLRVIIDQRISAFMANESSRHKDSYPSLGDFLPLISVSRYAWTTPGLARMVMDELFDRNVLWTCKAHPELAKIGNDRQDVPADHDRLNKTLKASAISMRLIQYHVYFLWLLRREKEQTVEDVAASNDYFYGKPPRKTVVAFQQRVQQILAVKRWDGVFRALYMPIPTPEYLTNWLIGSVRNSLRKRYHTRNTDFSMIHQSGVSKILLKGESYSAPSNLKKVLMEEVWRWPHHTIFLDASCSFFDFSDKHMGNVDYLNQWNQNRSIHHSGDVLDDNKKEGKHTISIDLVNLPKSVKTLVFCMTAFTTTLVDIKQPYVRFTDAESDMELCQYNFESNADTGRKTAITMCALWRDDSKGGKWSVTAIGHVGFGRVCEYSPLVKDLEGILRKLYGKTKPSEQKHRRNKFMSDDEGSDGDEYE